MSFKRKACQSAENSLINIPRSLLLCSIGTLGTYLELQWDSNEWYSDGIHTHTHTHPPTHTHTHPPTHTHTHTHTHTKTLSLFDLVTHLPLLDELCTDTTLDDLQHLVSVGHVNLHTVHRQTTCQCLHTTVFTTERYHLVSSSNVCFHAEPVCALVYYITKVFSLALTQHMYVFWLCEATTGFPYNRFSVQQVFRTTGFPYNRFSVLLLSLF